SCGVLCFCFFFQGSGALRYLPSFPTRRSSDLVETAPEFDCPELEANIGDACELTDGTAGVINDNCECDEVVIPACDMVYYLSDQDRKSTRLNSSHVKISYAVFCLKKKNKQTQR